MQGDLEPAKSAEQRISPPRPNRRLTQWGQTHSYFCHVSSRSSLHCCLYSEERWPRHPSQGVCSKHLGWWKPWCYPDYQVWVSLGIPSLSCPWVSLLVLPSVLMSLHNLWKKSTRKMPPVDAEAPLLGRWDEVGRSQGSLLTMDPPLHLVRAGGGGSHPLLPCKRALGGESVPSRSLRYKHSKHACCCLPTPEDFLVLSGDWKQAEMF